MTTLRRAPLLRRLDAALRRRAAPLATGVLAVLGAGVGGAVALPAAPAGAVQVAAMAAPEPVVLPAWELAPLPVDVQPVVPAPAPAAPAAPLPTRSPRPAAASAPAVPAAGAAADPLCSGAGWQQRRGAAALASLRRPSDATGFSVSYEAGRSGYIGLATVHQRRLQVFVRACDELSTALLRHVVAHELGHLVDGSRMSEAMRARYLQLRGIPAGTPWYGCNGCTDFATPAGDFAEVYAQWQTGERGNHSRIAPAPSSGELAAIAAAFFG